MAAMAQSAHRAGAVGIRTNGPDDVSAIAASVPLPIIGIDKQTDARGVRVITPDLASARTLVAAGAAMIALEATDQARPDWTVCAELIRAIREELRVPVMADVATHAEGLRAAAAGADLVATTMSGYTSYTEKTDGPDLRLLADLVRDCSAPVVAEGRFHTPELARQALEAGAFAVVVGSAITSPEFITHRFITGIKG